MEGGGLGGNRFGGGGGLTPRAPKRGPKSNIKKDPKKDAKRGTKGDPKNHKKAIRAEFLRVSSNGVPSRVSKSEILLLFTTLELGRASQKETQFWDHFGDRVCKKNEKRGFQKIIKNHVKKTLQSGPQNRTIWGSFRDPLQSN